MNRKIFTLMLLSALIGYVLLYPNSAFVNLFFDYQLEEFENQTTLYKAFERENDDSYGTLFLLKNGKYEESESMIHGCMTEIDLAKGPWREIGGYEIHGDRITLYPAWIKERVIYNDLFEKTGYNRKLSLPNTSSRNLIVLGNYDSLIEDGNNRIYHPGKN